MSDNSHLPTRRVNSGLNSDSPVHVRGRPGTDEGPGRGDRAREPRADGTALHNWPCCLRRAAADDDSTPPPARRRRRAASAASAARPRGGGRRWSHQVATCVITGPGEHAALRSPSRPLIMQAVGSGSGAGGRRRRTVGYPAAKPTARTTPPGRVSTGPESVATGPGWDDAGRAGAGWDGSGSRVGGGCDGWVTAAADQKSEGADGRTRARIGCSQPSLSYRRL